MKKRNTLIMASLLLVLTLLASFTAYIIFKKSACSKCKNVIVFWNNTDRPLALELRFTYLKPQYVEIAPHARACIPSTSSKEFESWDALRYMMVSFGEKKYKFVKQEGLNTYEKGKGDMRTRYFMLSFLDFNSEVWDCVKKNYQEKDKDLDESYRYIILSSYPKTSSPWGSKAHIQALRAKRFRLKIPSKIL